MAQHFHSQDPHSTDPRQRVSAHYYQPQPQPRVYPPPGAGAAPRPRRPIRRAPSRQSGGGHPGRFLLAGGSMLALATLVVTPSINSADSQVSSGAKDVCIKQIDKQSLISRDELQEVLDLDKQVSKEKVQAIVEQPHCVLEARTGANSVRVEREAYPLEFDPQTWFVLLYQDGKYTGYDFSFR